MKTIRMALGFIVGFWAYSSFAGIAFQAPVPIPKDDVARLTFAVGAGSDFKGIYLLNGGMGAAFALGKGFEAGFDVGAGAFSIDDSWFTQNQYKAIGLSAMLRYFGALTQNFNLGFSWQVDYFRAFKKSIFGEGFGEYTLTSGLPFSFVFEKAGAFYLVPELNIYLQKASSGGSLSSLVGGDLRVGGLVNLGTDAVSLMLEAAPNLYDFTKIRNNWGVEFLLGLTVQL